MSTKLKRWLKERKNTIKRYEFAERIGVTNANLGHYIMARYLPGPAIMQKITKETNGEITPNDMYLDRLIAKRVGTAITEPLLDANQRSINTWTDSDGNRSVEFTWRWKGNEGDIDGFYIYQKSSKSSRPYTFGAKPSKNLVAVCDPNLRSVVITNVEKGRYYTFGVCTFVKVDKDLDPSGIITSDIVQPTRPNENPFRIK